jgi:hypothetical protein
MAKHIAIQYTDDWDIEINILTSGDIAIQYIEVRDIAINILMAQNIALQYIVVADIAINILMAEDIAIQYSPTIPIYFRTFEDMMYTSSYLLSVHMIVPTDQIENIRSETVYGKKLLMSNLYIQHSLLSVTSEQRTEISQMRPTLVQKYYRTGRCGTCPCLPKLSMIPVPEEMMTMKIFRRILSPFPPPFTVLLVTGGRNCNVVSLYICLWLRMLQFIVLPVTDSAIKVLY